MDEIQTRGAFFPALDEAIADIKELYALHPDKTAILDEFRLQLDIMQRRTADDGVPTELEKNRIKIFTQTKHYFPGKLKPPRKTVRFLKRLRDIAYCYVTWETLPP